MRRGMAAGFMAVLVVVALAGTALAENGPRLPGDVRPAEHGPKLPGDVKPMEHGPKLPGDQAR